MPATPIDALLRKGLAADGAGRPGDAAAAYEEVLKLAPQNADALQLLGLLAKRSGELVRAEALMRRSLQSRTAQPHVWNNLGNLLAAVQRPDEALECFARAVALQPTYADAHYNLARTLDVAGRKAEARQALNEAIKLKPGQPAMLQLRAMLDLNDDRVDDALATLDAAVTLTPQRAPLHHNRAVALQRLDRAGEALAAHEQAHVLGLDEADAHYNLGNTLQALGRRHEALAAYRAALQREPLHALTLADLARLRWRLGDDDFCAELNTAEREHPASQVPCAIRGGLTLRAERFAEAEQAYRMAIERAPEAAGCHDGLAQALMRQGCTAAAIVAHRRAILLAPKDTTARAHFARTLLLANDAQQALLHAEEACRLAPDDQLAIAMLGLACRSLGDARDAWLNDISRWVRCFDLPAPAAWSSMAAFNVALATELQTLHTDLQAPVDQSLRLGTQTLGNLFNQRHTLVGQLRPLIEDAVRAYIHALPIDIAHPLLRRNTGQWRFDGSWSSCLHSGGRHLNHVHTQGWISSAYYVAVPGSVVGSANHEGWLQFGEPDVDIGLATRQVVQPQPSRLVLFPSYLWHGTLPFSDAGKRLTIAFDVKPS